MTISELKQAKIESGLSCESIANMTGVPLSTVQKVFSGITRRPRSETIKKLSYAFREVKINTIDEDSSIRYTNPRSFVQVAESAIDYGRPISQEPAFEPGSREPFKRQGTYTIDDYYRVPDDRRVELIDGVFYDMTAPRTIHQHLVGFIFSTIYNFIEANDGDCIPFGAPTDVRLDILRDDRTMVQPDVFVLCDNDKLDDRNVKGGPDLVIEVLSPSTRKKDITIKTQKYSDAGVREYWIVDPRHASITVYDFQNDYEIRHYRFGDQVPVSIYSGDLIVDFGCMPKYINRMYDSDWNLLS